MRWRLSWLVSLSGLGGNNIIAITAGHTHVYSSLLLWYCCVLPVHVEVHVVEENLQLGDSIDDLSFDLSRPISHTKSNSTSYHDTVGWW